MPDVTDEELAAALKAAEDENGVDQRLAQATAAMTPEQRRMSEESIRRWMEAARRGREAERATDRDALTPRAFSQRSIATACSTSSSAV